MPDWFETHSAAEPDWLVADLGQAGRPEIEGRWSLAEERSDGDGQRMAWFLRAIEQSDGQWACSHGRVVFDSHDELSAALEHLRDIAATMSPAELFVHSVDGDVRHVGSV